MAHDWIVQLAASTSASGQGLEVGLWRISVVRTCSDKRLQRVEAV
jgi:hypothetical protein